MYVKHTKDLLQVSVLFRKIRMVYLKELQQAYYILLVSHSLEHSLQPDDKSGHVVSPSSHSTNTIAMTHIIFVFILNVPIPG